MAVGTNADIVAGDGKDAAIKAAGKSEAAANDTRLLISTNKFGTAVGQVFSYMFQPADKSLVGSQPVSYTHLTLPTKA